MYDLEIVAVLNANVTKLGTRHDLQIPFDRHTERVQPKAVDHLGDADAFRDPPVLSVNADTEAAIETHRAGAIRGEFTCAKPLEGGREARRLTERTANRD